MSRSIYVIGSLRNPRVPEVAKALRAAGFDAFDDWYSSGEHGDDEWRDYEKARGNDLVEALKGYTACHVFKYDLLHLNRCDAAVLVSPAGKSAHLELGYMRGKGKPAYVLLDGDPDRYDMMLKFATAVFRNLDEMLEALR